MNLEFQKVNGSYVAEFTATGDFAVHMEKNNNSPVHFYQTSIEGTQYDLCKSLKMAAEDRVLDIAVPLVVSPMYLKVVSYELPTMAVITIKE